MTKRVDEWITPKALKSLYLIINAPNLITMKVVKTLIFVFLSLIALVNKIYAQKDYVITSKKDTIFCKVRTHGLINPVLQYRVSEKDNYTDFDSTITEYFIAKDTGSYVFKKDPVHKYQGFVKWIERGRINLYTREVAYSSMNAGTGMVNGGTTTYYYASKGDGDLTLMSPLVGPRKYREKVFFDLFSDDIILQEKFKNARKSDHSGSFTYDCIEEYNKAYARIDSIGSNAWDYIVTKKNDTVRCRLKYDFLTGNYLYRAKDKNDYVKIDSSYINGYFNAVDNITFKLITLPEQNKKEFVKWLEKGTVNLFERTELVGDTGDRSVKYYWYVNKNNEHLISIKIKAEYVYDLRTHKDQLAAFRSVISDDKNLLAEFNNNFKDADPNTDNAIRYYVQQYNEKHLTGNKTGR